MARTSSAVPLLLALAMLAALGLVGFLLLDVDDGGASVDSADPEQALGQPGDEPVMDLVPLASRGDAEPLAVEPEVERVERGDDRASPRPTPRGPGRRVAGRLVRLADESPLADVRVRGLRGETRTDDQGAFELADVGVDERVLVISLPGDDAEATLPDSSEDLADLRFVIDTGWNVPGVLLSSAGGAVAGGRVRAGRDDWVDVDASGQFLLRDVRTESAERPAVELSAQGPWHALQTERVRLPLQGRVAAPVQLVLPGAGRVEGRLTMSDGSAPQVDEVRLAFERVHVGVERVEPELRDGPGADHTYRIEHVPAGSYIVELRGPDLERLTQHADALRARAEQLRASGAEHQLLAQSEAQLVQAQALAEAARARAEDPRAPPPLWLPDVVVQVGETTRLDIELPAGAVVRGRVTDGAGNPLEGARVEALRLMTWRNEDAGNGTSVSVFPGGRTLAERGEDGVHRTRFVSTLSESHSAADGRYVVGQLPPGEVLLRVTGPEVGARPVESTLRLAPGEQREDHDVVLVAGLAISGRLVGPGGVPVEGRVALVAAEGPVAITSDDQVATDAEGHFEFVGLGPEARRLWVMAPGYLGVTERVEPGGAPLLLELEPAPMLAGRVLDAFSYEPIPAFRVIVRTESSSTSRTVQAPDGRFVFDSLDDQLYTLEVQAAGYEAQVLPDVRPGFDGRELEVLLTPDG